MFFVAAIRYDLSIYGFGFNQPHRTLMNYRHLYHAGNFADVIKHIMLIVLLNTLKQKITPFCLIDTHAGIGLYPLDSTETQKQKEYKTGIEKLFFNDNENIPECITNYLSIIKKFNISNKLHYYPGSPLIAAEILRENDQLILSELHNEDVKTLKKNMVHYQNVAIHHLDAYLSMKAFIPPKQKRGLVLIDPPFEHKNEFELIYNALQRALKHWNFGHFLIWFPIKNHKTVDQFLKKIKLLQKPALVLHCSLAEIEKKLSACGLIFINPPFQIKELLQNTVLPYLQNALQIQFQIDELP